MILTIEHLLHFRRLTIFILITSYFLPNTLESRLRSPAHLAWRAYVTKYTYYG